MSMVSGYIFETLLFKSKGCSREISQNTRQHFRAGTDQALAEGSSVPPLWRDPFSAGVDY
jgi:hypothetical protein